MIASDYLSAFFCHRHKRTVKTRVLRILPIPKLSLRKSRKSRLNQLSNCILIVFSKSPANERITHNLQQPSWSHSTERTMNSSNVLRTEVSRLHPTSETA